MSGLSQETVNDISCAIFFTVLLPLLVLLWRKRTRRSILVVWLCILGMCSIYLRSNIYQLAIAGGREHLDGIYVNKAYRTADNEIRFIYYKNSKLRPILKYWNGEEYINIQERKVDPIMRLFVDCRIEAHIGVVRFQENVDAEGQLLLTTDTSSEIHRVRVRDVRPPANFNPASFKYPHKLGVCLQPIYLHSDWTLVVQFFEFWLASGATKFYIYLHSATRHVRAMLDFYQRKLGPDLEIIEWSDLPVAQMDKGDFYQDPNTRLFQVGLYAAINDCLLRSRYHVKFLSMLDLDETLQVSSGRYIIHELESLSTQHPNMGTASLQWIYAEQEVHTVYANFRKLIQRPERVVLTDIHSTLVNELLEEDERPPETGEMTGVSRAVSEHDLRTSKYRYEEVRVPADRLSVIHLRRFNPAFQGSKRSYSMLKREFRPFASTSRAMNANFLARISNDTIRDYNTGDWQVALANTMRTLEECRYFPFNYKQTIGKGACQAVANCEPLISDLHIFTKAEPIWTDVAHRGKVIEYVKH